MASKKLKIGIFSFTGDEGCVIEFVEILNNHYRDWIKLVDFRYAKVLKSKNELSDIDVAFVEGAISTFNEEEKLKKIREASKKVVAIGSCAINGTPSNHRNFFDEARMEEIRPIMDKFGHRPTVSPLHEIIQVDDNVPGCPILEKPFIDVMMKYLKEFGVAGE